MFSSKSRLSFILALTAAVVFSSSPSFARGGRGGGGRGAGGDRAAGRGISGDNFSRNPGQAGRGPRDFAGDQQLDGGLQRDGEFNQLGTFNDLAPESQVVLNPYQQQVSRFQQRSIGPNDGQALQNRTQNFANVGENFSPADGTQAWQYTHPHADAAAVATAADVTAWLGSENYIPNDDINTAEDYQENSSDETNTSDAFNDQMSANVSTDPRDWMPLGNYSVVTNPGTAPTFMLQLAVDRTGKLGGVYYDSITNTSHNIAGNLDRATQVAQWTLENNPQLTFQAPLNELLKPTASVEVNLPAGSLQWQLVRDQAN